MKAAITSQYCKSFNIMLQRRTRHGLELPKVGEMMASEEDRSQTLLKAMLGV